MDNRNVVVLGGGTGLSTMLRGLKMCTQNITAIVTVADDGGSSGILRNDYGMLPPGDIRNCVSALADVDPIAGELLNFRFKDGQLKGHSLGNLMLAALNEMSDSFEEAVAKFNSLMGVVGTVYPVTNEDVTLSAVLEDGTEIDGESAIGKHRKGAGKRIVRVMLSPKSPRPVDNAVEAINKADIIVLGPGSLYTSIIPNLLVEGIADAIRKSKAKKIYVCNIMTQPGETEKYTVYDHLHAIEEHSYEGIADAVIVNTTPIPDELKEAYAAEFAETVRLDRKKIPHNIITIEGNLMLIRNDKVRHNFSRLARAIMSF